MVLISHLNPEVIKIVRSYILNDYALHQYKDIIIQELHKSLQEESYENNVTARVTYINKMPTGEGTEEGNFMALEFSSAFIRVMLVSILNKQCTVTSKSFKISQLIQQGKANRIFHYAAKCVADFLSALKLKMLRIPLGFVFGFPFEQSNLQEARLVRWTSPYSCNEVVGENIPDRLRRAFRRFKELSKVYIIGVLSESCSNLLAGSWQYPKCLISINVGRGARSSYIEHVRRVPKYEPATFSEKTIVMDVDSSSMGDTGCLQFIRNEFDEELDMTSSQPGQRINEKMISTSCLGELSRLALVRCIQEKLILDGRLTQKLATKGSFKLFHMSRVESDSHSGKHDLCREVFKEFGYGAISDEDCIQVQFVCRCVSRRSANLVAAQLAALLKRIGQEEVTIAGSGELLKNYPNYLWYLNKKLRRLRDPNISYEITLTEDDAMGRGAGLAAALFGKEAMEGEDKLRRLPPFSAKQCHMNPFSRCVHPNYSASHPPNNGVSEVQKEDQKQVGSCHKYLLL